MILAQEKSSRRDNGGRSWQRSHSEIKQRRRWASTHASNVRGLAATNKSSEATPGRARDALPPPNQTGKLGRRPKHKARPGARADPGLVRPTAKDQDSACGPRVRLFNFSIRPFVLIIYCVTYGPARLGESTDAFPPGVGGPGSMRASSARLGPASVQRATGSSPSSSFGAESLGAPETNLVGADNRGGFRFLHVRVRVGVGVCACVRAAGRLVRRKGAPAPSEHNDTP
jgi:hypothetical protein